MKLGIPLGSQVVVNEQPTPMKNKWIIHTSRVNIPMLSAESEVALWGRLGKDDARKGGFRG
jgi:hypothetical protein